MNEKAKGSFSKPFFLFCGRIFYWSFCKISSVFLYSYASFFGCWRNLKMFFPLTEVFVFMKIVVMNSPKFLAPFLRMIFKIGREN